MKLFSGECEAIRAASDLEGACVPFEWLDSFKAPTPRDPCVTSPTRPPGGGRARPGVNPGESVTSVAARNMKGKQKLAMYKR